MISTQIQSVQRWTRYHAFVVFTTFVLSIFLNSAIPLAMVGLFSFIVLIVQHQTVISEQGMHSFWRMLPNVITFVRMVVVVLIALFFHQLSPFLLGLLGFIILVFDKVDGYVAQKQRMRSLLGAQFDQETDAFFIGIYALILYLNGYAGIWITILGLLRYLNIIALVLLKQQHKKEPRFLAARLVATMVMIALLVPFVTPAWLYTPYAVLSVICLVCSFTYTFSAHIAQSE